MRKQIARARVSVKVRRSKLVETTLSVENELQNVKSGQSLRGSWLLEAGPVSTSGNVFLLPWIDAKCDVSFSPVPASGYCRLFANAPPVSFNRVIWRLLRWLYRIVSGSIAVPLLDVMRSFVFLRTSDNLLFSVFFLIDIVTFDDIRSCYRLA